MLFSPVVVWQGYASGYSNDGGGSDAGGCDDDTRVDEYDDRSDGVCVSGNNENDNEGRVIDVVGGGDAGSGDDRDAVEAVGMVSDGEEYDDGGRGDGKSKNKGTECSR